MARPKKNPDIQTVQVDGIAREVDASGNVEVLGLFPVQQWDIDEEFSNNEALREYRRDTMESESF
jgi:hypothetical protein